MFPGFNRHEILRRHYAAQVASVWKWSAIVAEAAKHKEPNLDDDDSYIGRAYLGTVFAIMPSGKFYAPWTTNQKAADETRDAAYMEALEEAADKAGGWIENGEGDPCDMFFCMSFPATPEDAIELWLCQDCMFAEVNGDYAEDDKRAKEVETALAELSKAGHLAPNFQDGHGEHEFSRDWCDCCGTTLAGARFRFAQFPHKDGTNELY